MKYIIIGLGKLGKALAESFATSGHEVIGVDFNMHEVDAVKDSITAAICMDTKDENALKTLPLKEADAVYITYGEDFGTSVHTAALLKHLSVKQLIVRGISPLHETIMRAIGISKILSPEIDYANEFVSSLELGDSMEHWYKVTTDYHIIKVKVPESLIGMRIKGINFKELFHLNLICILRPVVRTNFIGITDKKPEPLENINDEMEFTREDLLVLFGKPEHYNKIG